MTWDSFVSCLFLKKKKYFRRYQHSASCICTCIFSLLVLFCSGKNRHSHGLPSSIPMYYTYRVHLPTGGWQQEEVIYISDQLAYVMLDSRASNFDQLQ